MQALPVEALSMKDLRQFADLERELAFATACGERRGGPPSRDSNDTPVELALNRRPAGPV